VNWPRRPGAGPQTLFDESRVQPNWVHIFSPLATQFVIDIVSLNVESTFAPKPGAAPKGAGDDAACASTCRALKDLNNSGTLRVDVPGGSNCGLRRAGAGGGGQGRHGRGAAVRPLYEGCTRAVSRCNAQGYQVAVRQIRTGRAGDTLMLDLC